MSPKYNQISIPHTCCESHLTGTVYGHGPFPRCRSETAPRQVDGGPILKKHQLGCLTMTNNAAGGMLLRTATRTVENRGKQNLT